MDALLMIGLALTALLSLILSKILLTYGKSIDQYPVSWKEQRDISLWSPMMFTQLSVRAFWPLFIIGAFMLFQPSRFLLVGGIALITGLILYIGTAVVFSVSVFNAMASAGKESNRSNLAPGVMDRFSPFPLKPGIGSRFRPQGTSSRTGFPGYKK